MTAPTPPPTVLVAPPPDHGPNRRKVLIGIGAAVVAVAVVAGLIVFGLNRDDGDDAGGPTTTRPTAGLLPDSGLDDPPAELPEVPRPARGVGDAGGVQAHFFGPATPTSLNTGVGPNSLQYEGYQTAAYGAVETLAVPGDTGGPGLEDLARHWIGDRRQVTVRPVTIAGAEGYLAHGTVRSAGQRTERYLAVFRGPNGPVIALLDGANVTPESLQREWLTFTASIEPTA